MTAPVVSCGVVLVDERDHVFACHATGTSRWDLPKGMADRINEVVLEITPDYRIARIQFQEADESVTEYRFSGQQENSDISDQRFRFTPPPGAEIVDDSFGQ